LKRWKEFQALTSSTTFLRFLMTTVAFFLCAKESHTLAALTFPDSYQNAEHSCFRERVSAGISVAMNFADSLLASV
jgi:hypothetical protein